ncbi:MAG: hypothetical protein ABIJ52_00550, partial [Pseudomonadota bacterium]
NFHRLVEIKPAVGYARIIFLFIYRYQMMGTVAGGSIAVYKWPGPNRSCIHRLHIVGKLVIRVCFDGICKGIPSGIKYSKTL